VKEIPIGAHTATDGNPICGMSFEALCAQPAAAKMLVENWGKGNGTLFKKKRKCSIYIKNFRKD